MAFTAQAQGAVPLEGSALTARPIAAGRRRWPLAAIGLGGAGLLVAAIVALTVTAGTVVSRSAVGEGPRSASGNGGAVVGGSDLVPGYATLVERYQRAERAWTAQESRIGIGSPASAEALIRPSVQFADAVDQFDRDLVRLPWPAPLRRDVDALEAALATVSGDLRSVGAQRLSSMPQWVSNIRGDAAKSSADSAGLMRRLEAATQVRS